MRRPKEQRPREGEVRVRREPPTLDEAIFAAQGLSDDLDLQAEIAAGLMGLSKDEVRPSIPAKSVTVRTQGVARTLTRDARGHAFAVERRSARPRIVVRVEGGRSRD